MKIVCVGDCGVDRYHPSGHESIGGITANFARNARHEFPVSDKLHVISRVGDDNEGLRVISAMQTPGITLHIGRLPGKTPVQHIEVGPDGERNFTAYEVGVLGEASLDSEEQHLVSTADLLVAPQYRQIADWFGELMAIEIPGLVAVDFADFREHPDVELLERHAASVDIGFFGLAASDVDLIERIADLARSSNSIFIVTLGPDGSRAFTGNECFDCPAAPVAKVIDTTGAGDAFAAGFLARYCHGGDIRSALHNGAVRAASMVCREGSW